MPIRHTNLRYESADCDVTVARPSGTNRACEECKRKKTKCDGTRPQCLLCTRICATCVYPQRKSRVKDRWRKRSRGQDDTRNSQSSNSRSSPQRDAQVQTEMQTEIQTELQTELQQQHNIPSHFGPSPLADTAVGAEELSLAFEDPMWANMVDNFQLVQNPAANRTDPLSATDQDMIECLIESIPDIWQTKDGSHLDYFTTPTTSDFCATSSRSPGIVASFATPEDQRGEQISPPVHTMHSLIFRGDKTGSQGEAEERCSLNVPTAVVDDLIDWYFNRVQVFLPLFHRPTFHKAHVPTGDEQKYTNLRKESAFVLYGMMALSARFSELSCFSGKNVKERGSPFAHQAQEIYNQKAQSFRAQVPSLIWLQGCVLLAYYNQTCSPAKGCDLLVATCTRFAYDLDLYSLDEDESSSTDPSPKWSPVEQWILKEEKRRAWWCVWELDAFDSIASRRPFTIDRSRMFVYLPVSDEAWFKGTPVESVTLHPNFLQCWKALKDSPNQDERAWFLIGNFIAVQAFELCQRRHVAQENIDDVETVISCFAHLFYEKFQGFQLQFDESNYAKCNWVLLTRLMVQSARVTICMLNSRSLSEPVLTAANRFLGTAETSVVQGRSESSTSIEDYFQPAGEIFKIYRSWAPEYIGFVPPTMVCVITGPAAAILRYARLQRKAQHRGGDMTQPSIQEDLLVLILGRFARYWNIGLLLLNFVQAFER